MKRKSIVQTIQQISPLLLSDIHNQLSLVTSFKHNAFNPSELLEKYIQLIIDGEKNNTETFEMFCQMKGFQLLSSLRLKYRAHILNSISMLLINIKRQECIMYILSQPLLSELIREGPGNLTEDQLSFYISLMKSLAIRLDSSTVALFYNKKNSMFPLAWNCSLLYNHPQNMIRTGAMNALLTLIKINNKQIQEYFSTFPFVTFYANVVINLQKDWQKMQNYLLQNKFIKPILQDHKQGLMLLIDILQIAEQKIQQQINKCLQSYLIKPIIKSFCDKSSKMSIKLGLVLLGQYLNLFKHNSQIQDFIFEILLKPRLSEEMINWLLSEQCLVFSRSSTWSKHHQNIQFLMKGRLDQRKSLDGVNLELLYNITQFYESIHHPVRNHSQTSTLNPFWKMFFTLFNSKDQNIIQLLARIIIFFLNQRDLPSSTNQIIIQSIFSIIGGGILYPSDVRRALYHILFQIIPKQIQNELVQQKFKNILFHSLQNMMRLIKAQSNHLIVIRMPQIISKSQQIYQSHAENIKEQINYFEESHQTLIDFVYLTQLLYKFISKNDKFAILKRFYTTDTFRKLQSPGYLQNISKETFIKVKNQLTGQKVIILFKDYHFIFLEYLKKDFGKVIKIVNYKQMKWQQLSRVSLAMIQSDEKVCEIMFDSQQDFSKSLIELKMRRSNFLKAQLIMLAEYINQCFIDAQMLRFK